MEQRKAMALLQRKIETAEKEVNVSLFQRTSLDYPEASLLVFCPFQLLKANIQVKSYGKEKGQEKVKDDKYAGVENVI